MSDAPWRIRALRGLLRRLPRGRYRALASAPDQGRFTARLATEVGGAMFDCDLSDLLSREVCFTGLYEPPVTRVFQRQCVGGRRDSGQWDIYLLPRRPLARQVPGYSSNRTRAVGPLRATSR